MSHLKIVTANQGAIHRFKHLKRKPYNCLDIKLFVFAYCISVYFSTYNMTVGTMMAETCSCR